VVKSIKLKACAAPAPRCLQGYHYALCVFGLTRSLNWTVHSMEKRIMEPITRAGHTYDIFMHTYAVERLDSPITGEELPYTHANDHHLLNLTRYRRVCQTCIHMYTWALTTRSLYTHARTPSATQSSFTGTPISY
jgi:hypothetical protein